MRYLLAMIGGGAGIVDATGVFLLFTHWLLYLLAVIGSSSLGLNIIKAVIRAPRNQYVQLMVAAVIFIGMFLVSIAFLVTGTFNPFCISDFRWDSYDEQKKKARIANLIGKIFIILLFLVMIINMIVPDREESELENRALEQRPRFNLTTILSGDFMEQWEKYLSDQFAGRDTWRSLKVSLDRLGGARKENDIYIGKDGQLMEDIEVPDDGRLEANLTAIRDFAETYEDIPVTMMLVPDAACILNDSLPAFARVEDQRQMFSMAERKLGDTVNWVDTVSILNNHKSEKLYYKTDHHWTTQGAFYVFQDAAETLGIEGDVSDDFVSYTVTDSFNGVLAASSGVGLDEMEQIDIYAPTGGDDDGCGKLC